MIYKGVNGATEEEGEHLRKEEKGKRETGIEKKIRKEMWGGGGKRKRRNKHSINQSLKLKRIWDY